ncbi:MAG: PQQ-like beta-propeller repeat protein [Bacteroidales bacterium]|nr:PQQ-like beta-propeller repeat protein [Bacteroidales bacterium]MBN2632084.1 PQQ-like beta-propeller repeat protein [Bacteroidales bacterium]
MRFAENDIRVIRNISQVAGIFTLIVGLLMIFSLIQLKTINPLDNPALLSVKEQFDKDQENAVLAEQVRAMDLMARKAYFSSRRQLETGSWLILAGAVVFIICQRLIAGNEKIMPGIPGSKPDEGLRQQRYRKYLTGSAVVLTAGAILASFLLRSNLPDLSGNRVKALSAREARKAQRAATRNEFDPDDTNWPVFRGEDGRGIAGGSGYPLSWNGEDGTGVKWKTVIPSDGKSSPVIWGDRLFVTGAEELECFVHCYDKNNGTLLWTSAVSGLPGEPAELPKMDRDAGLAVSSAAVNAKAVCAIFANGNLAAFDHDGNSKWAFNLGVPANIYGYSSSLIIHDDILVVQYDSDEKISVMGYDIENGELKWETLRQGSPAWSSPAIGIFGGITQVIINGNPFVSAYDPSDGKELWTIDCMYGDVAPSPAINSSMVFSVTDYSNLVAIEAGVTPVIKWQDNSYTPDIPSPVATDEFLFLVTGYGDAVCYNTQTGDTLWTHYFGDQFYSSPIIADGMVWFMNRSGLMHIVKAAGAYEPVAESQLGEAVECTPAFSDKNIYIRGRKNLYCISGK